MTKALIVTALLVLSPALVAVAADEATLEDTELKFAFYSSAWGENANAGLRLVAFNRSENQMRLDSIRFLNEQDQSFETDISLALEISPLRYAEINLPYIDLLSGDECVDRSMQDDWKLVEISNYTLNPSVRNLIIENTDSFRIYQCVKSVSTSWTNLKTGDSHQYTEWVLYHFENRPPQ